MKRSLTVAVAAALCGSLLAVDGASALDSVVKVGKQPRATGNIQSVTANEVTIDLQGKVEKIPVTEIESIEFDGEPGEMKLARGALRTGGDQTVITQLERINVQTLTRKEVKQDYNFYYAQALARKALRGAGDVKQAGGAMYEFVDKNPDSYHYLQGQELLGELLVADGNVAKALEAFSKLDASPFNEYKMRAGVARGRALMSQQQFAEALVEFEKVLALPYNATTDKGTPTESQRFAAVLGKAQCQANTGAYDQAIQELEQNVIPNLAVEETQLQALAYNTLGTCYNQKPDGKKAALLAFLHVDMLYTSVPNAHAEALWNLSKIWNDIGRTERGNECLDRLNRFYPGSPWLTKR